MTFSRNSALKEVGIDIVSIAVGVLIARIVIVWLDVLKHYSESLTYRDSHEKNKSRKRYLSRWRSAIIVTLAVILVVILIYSWYMRSVVHEKYV